MKYVDEFRDKRLIEKLAGEIRRALDTGRTYNIMEVCGTHTMSIFKFGLGVLLPANIKLISGPGCPVCVTPNEFLDKAIALSNIKNVIIATFGDMLKVPGSYSSLEKERAKGNLIKVVYSTENALAIAKDVPDKEVVFLAVGFETTAPTVAASILTAKRDRIHNYSILCGHKTMPGTLKILAADKRMNIDGFMLPGHVSAVIGIRPYRFLAKRYGKRCVVAGFEPLDIMQAILMLITQDTPKVDIQYTRLIKPSGNTKAMKVIEKVFVPAPSTWRGLGIIRKSGLKLKKEFSDFDAEVKFKLKIKPAREHSGCICGDVLKGIKTPLECRLYARACNPENPVGACMVSSEGACAAYYRFGDRGQNG